jgi:hypothetical protein
VSRHEIQFIESRKQRKLHPLTGAVYFKPSGRLRRVQSWVWSWLQRAGCLHPVMEERIHVTSVVVDTGDLLQRIQRQRREVFEQINRDGQRLLIGRDDFAELMQLASFDGPHFSLRGELFSSSYDGSTRVLGLTVEVIPWMRGILVVP